MSKSVNRIEVYRGQSKDIELILTKPSTDIDGNPITIPFDLTGCTLYFTVKTNGNAQRALISKTSTDSSQIEIQTPFKNGVAIMFLLPVDTKYLNPDTYQFDIWVQQPDSEIFPVVEVSEFTVLQPITVL